MGKRFKKLGVKRNLKDWDEFLWVNSVIPRPTYSTTRKLQLSPKHTAAYKNNTAATHRAREPTHQVTGKPSSLPLNKGWFLAQVGSSRAFVFPSYRKSGQWCCTGLLLLTGPKGERITQSFLSPHRGHLSHSSWLIFCFISLVPCQENKKGKAKNLPTVWKHIQRKPLSSWMGVLRQAVGLISTSKCYQQLLDSLCNDMHQSNFPLQD